MQVVAKLTSAATDVLRSGGNARGPDELGQVMQTYGIQLKPLHPSVARGELAKFFVVQVADQVQANTLLESLRKLSSVEGAYMTPAATPPAA